MFASRLDAAILAYLSELLNTIQVSNSTLRPRLIVKFSFRNFVILRDIYLCI